MTFTIYFATLFLKLLTAAIAQNGTTEVTYDISPVEKVIAELKEDKDLVHANWGFCLMDAETGEVIYEYNDQKSLMPASTMKLLSTAGALMELGPAFKFQTRLQYAGEIDANGTLKGNLYIKGGGDPTLGSAKINGSKGMSSQLNEWVEAVKERGISRIEGNIIGDATFFDDLVVPSSWSYGDMGNYYAAAASGLSFNDNSFRVLFKAGIYEGAPTVVEKTNPEIPDMEFMNFVTTGPYGSWDDAYLHGAPLNHFYVIKGTVPPGKDLFGIKGAIPNPPHFTAYHFKKALEKADITVQGTPEVVLVESDNPDTVRTSFHVTYSPPLEEILRYINEESDNLYAEHIMKIFTLKTTGTSRYEKASEKMKHYWGARGCPVTGMEIKDGSGLSRRNLITPFQMSKILSIIANDSLFEVYYKSLAIAGRTGTLSYMCTGTPAENNVHGKSGTITGAKAYGGYVTSASGRLMTFSMIANHYTSSNTGMRLKWEKLMTSLARVQ